MKIYGAIRTVIYWVLTALVIVFVSTLAEIEVLRYFIGGIMIFYGVEDIIYNVVKHKKHDSLHVLYWNIIEMLIGFTLVVFVESGDVAVTYAVVCVCWAIWSILRESRELVEATEVLKGNKLMIYRIVAILNLLESLTVIAMSLTMMIEPGEHHARIHLYLLAAELLSKMLFPIIYYTAERLEAKKWKAVDAVLYQPQSETVDVALDAPQSEMAQTVFDAPQSETVDGEVAALSEEQQKTETPETGVTEQEKEG